MQRQTGHRSEERDAASGYQYSDNAASHTQQYLWPHVVSELNQYLNPKRSTKRVFELGCGNGAMLVALEKSGFDVVGVDPSISGIAEAQSRNPPANAHVGSAYEDLQATYGVFPAVISLEVVEHVYSPKLFAKTLYSLVEPGGIAIVSTPYHGYLKNVALAVSGKMDSHFTALWDHGHIKFWSVRTLSALLLDAGFGTVRYRFAGRVPFLAKSMIAIAQRPA